MVYHFKYTKVTKIINIRKSESGFYIPFNSQGHIGTGPQHCHLWGLKPTQR